MNQTSQPAPKPNLRYGAIQYVKFIFFSAFGVILFFTPVKIGGTRSIPLDHLITYMNNTIPLFGQILTIIIATVGGLLPWINGNFKKSALMFVLAVFRLSGVPLCMMGFNYELINTYDKGLNFLVGPDWIMQADFIPFVWEKIAVAVTFIVVIGSIFLTFIVAYGLLEFTGVIVKPIMRPLYNVPGKAAINAVAAFIGSFSVAMFLTDKLYKESKYTYKEAAIVMTGFSTVSATFMIVIAKTAQFMSIWNFYFWSTLVITLLVTAVTVRLFPLRNLPNTYIDGIGKPEPKLNGNAFRTALSEGVGMAASSKNLLKILWENIVGGIKMCFVLTPTGTTVGLLALILLNTTPVFDYLGYLFYPFTYLLSIFGLAEPAEVARATAVGLGEIFVPNIIVSSLSDSARYIISVVTVSTIIFFAGFIPCLYATSIKIAPWKVLVLWFQRAAIAVVLAGIVSLVYFR